jgi:hypothetical protein
MDTTSAKLSVRGNMAFWWLQLALLENFFLLYRLSSKVVDGLLASAMH